MYYTHKPLNYVTIIQNNMLLFYNRHFLVWKGLKILKMYLVNTANRNGQINGIHCVGVADGIVG